MAGNLSDIILNQALEYNKQQLSSLATACEQQIKTMEYLKRKIYELKSGAEGSLYDSIQIILKDNKPFVSFDEYNEYVGHAENILTFFRLVQGSLQTEMSLFLIKGAETGQGSINILWPMDNIGMVEYAREISTFFENNPLLREQERGMFPFVSESGPEFKRNFYIFYDFLHDRSSPDKITGYLINGYNNSDLSRILESFSYPLEGTAYVLDSGGTALYTSDVPDMAKVRMGGGGGA
jgi:hypothetical protein